jgi:tripartite-type tricarboxylate transporter receptor subunit TctC
MMKPARRRFLHLAAGAAALPVVSRIARAQTYPWRPVRWIVGFTPAGGNDIVARLMGQWLSERLGQPFVIENRPGAGTNIATEAVVNAPPDGYTLLLANLANAINATLYERLNFNFIHDIAPVAGISRAPLIMVIHPSVPVATVPEFIAYAKTHPGKVNMGSAGIGSAGHLAGELFKMMAGVNLVHVPYRGNAPALSDLIAGQVEVLFPSAASSIEYVKTSKLRGLAVTGATRSDALPDLPTVGDSIPGYEASSIYGIGAPRNTPAEIVDKLNKEVNGARRPQNEGAPRRSRWHAAVWIAGRLRQADRRRNREVGCGSQILGGEGELMRRGGAATASANYFQHYTRGKSHCVWAECSP